MSVPVVILAAGRGRRLSPLTDHLPKCLVPIGGTSCLESLLHAVTGVTAGDVTIVVGHARERIDATLRNQSVPAGARTLFNPRFDTSNNLYSAWLARSVAGGGFLLVNSDLLCHARLVEDAIGAAGNVLVVDPTTPPREEAMKVRYEGGRLRSISKQIDPTKADGEYIGIARFDREGAEAFFAAAERILEAGGQDEWYEAAIGQAAKVIPFGQIPTGGLPWIEIDSHEDLQRAQAEVLPELSGPHTRISARK